MAQKITVNGKTTSLPGIYVMFKSGINNPSIVQPYGNIVIIDDGIGAGFGGGAGVRGQYAIMKGSIYNFTTPQDFQNFVKGGPLWQLGEALFTPSKNLNVAGVSRVSFIRACTTTAATITYELDAATVSFDTLDEGLNANGVLSSGYLSAGYAAKLIVAPTDATKYVLQIFHSTYKGIDSLNNTPWDNVALANATPQLILQTDPVTNIEDIATWLQNSAVFNAGFTNLTLSGSGPIIPGDLISYPGFNLAAGGVEDYTDAGVFDDALTAVKDLDNTFFLCVNSDNGSLNDYKILDYITTQSKRMKFMYLNGGKNASDFVSNSIAAAEFYDSERVIVVHGQFKRSVQSGKKIYSALYKTAQVLGRACGLAPQDPLTSKDLWIDEEVHKMTEPEQELANAAGVLTTFKDIDLGYVVVLLGINTLQNNDYMVNPDGTSYLHSIGRIKASLSSDIIVNAKKKFYSGNTGPNRATLSSDDVIAWLQGFLQERCPTAKNPDSLILLFQNINVSVNGVATSINFQFEPNFEVDQMIFVPIMIDPQS